MKLALQIVLVVTSLLVVLLVLLHRAKGGGLSTLFGGGVQSSLAGSTVVEKNLDRRNAVRDRDLGGLDRRRRADDQVQLTASRASPPCDRSGLRRYLNHG